MALIIIIIEILKTIKWFLLEKELVLMNDSAFGKIVCLSVLTID